MNARWTPREMLTRAALMAVAASVLMAILMPLVGPLVTGGRLVP